MRSEAVIFKPGGYVCFAWASHPFPRPSKTNALFGIKI